MKQYLILFIVLVGAVVFSIVSNKKYIGNLNEFSDIKSNLPEFTAQYLNTNQSFSVKNLNQTKVLVHFWATWCAPCIEEMPLLIKSLSNSIQLNPTLSALIISTNDSKNNVKKFFKKLKLSISNENTNIIFLHDENGEILNKFGSYKLPETLIYKDSILIKHFKGPQKLE